MTPETAVALVGILVAGSWSPGPNNAMLAASGATWGFRRSVPLMAGISLGFPAMLFAVGLGLGAVFESIPRLHDVLRYVGAALLLWVAWRIATARAPRRGAGASVPLGFWTAAAFQLANPKAWVISIAIAAQFLTGENAVIEAAVAALVAIVCAATASVAWAGFGTWLGRWLTNPRRLRLFNWSMAGLVALGVVLMLAE